MNYVRRIDVSELEALVGQHVRDVLVMHQKMATLVATGTAGEETVEVSVDARDRVTKTEKNIVDESYLKGFEVSELDGYITSALQAAAAEVQECAARLLEPLTRRRQAISMLSGALVDALDLCDEVLSTPGAADSAGLHGLSVFRARR